MLNEKQANFLYYSIKRYMVDHNINQAEFAERIGVTKSSISNWQRTNYRKISNKTVSMILFVTTKSTEFPDELSHAHAVTLDAVKDEIVHKIVALPNVPREAIADIVKVIMEAGK